VLFHGVISTNTIGSRRPHLSVPIGMVGGNLQDQQCSPTPGSAALLKPIFDPAMMDREFSR
jgi:hypothetical protein